MQALFFSWLERIRSSYWFVPAMMALGAILLSTLSIIVDSTVGVKWIESLPWLFANKPEGARALLSTIAGSMITVAGVTFSITIVSVMTVAGRYGPRILTNFMRDRGNQITLGVFISTFIYCLLILRTVRTGDERPVGGGSSSTDLVSTFVPHFSVIIGILLALASIGVLIYFIHHVSESLHISNVIGRIGRDLQKHLERLDLKQSDNTSAVRLRGEGRREECDETEFFPLTLERFGYIEQINEASIVEIACANNLRLKATCSPGRFVNNRTVVLRVYSEGEVEVEGEIQEQLRDCFITGEQRSPTQDVMFLVDELVEIAGIALSPGVNDSFTAVTCIEWLGAALTTAATIEFPDGHHYDEEGTLRLTLPSVSFDQLLYQAFDQLRSTVASAPIVVNRMIGLLGDIREAIDSPEVRELLFGQGKKLQEACNELLSTEQDRKEVTKSFQRLVERL